MQAPEPQKQKPKRGGMQLPLVLLPTVTHRKREPVSIKKAVLVMVAQIAGVVLTLSQKIQTLRSLPKK